MRTLLLFVTAASLLGAADLGSAVQQYRSGNYAAAEKELRQVVAADSGNARAHHLLGMTLLQRGDPAGAAAELQRADQLQPGQADITLGLAQLYFRQNDLAKAETALNKAVQIDPQNPGIPLVRGQCELAKKNYSAAVSDLEKAVANEPKNAYAHYYLALAYNGMQKTDKMLEEFDAFLKLAPDTPESARARSVMKTVR